MLSVWREGSIVSPWGIGDWLCLGALIFTVAAAQTTTPQPQTTDADAGFLSRDMLLWIIIGISSLLGVTCVFIFIFTCIIWRRRTRKRKFTIRRPTPVHGDAIRGVRSLGGLAGSQEIDPAVQTPQSTAEIGRGDTVIPDVDSARSFEMMPLEQQSTTDAGERGRDVPT